MHRKPSASARATNAAYSRSETNQAFTAAEDILRNRGDQPRQKQNRLIFLAPDYDVVGRLKEQARIFLAWKSIVTDIENGNLNQYLAHLNQAKRNRDGAEQSLSQLVRETYKWLIAPIEEFVKDKPELNWEAVSISPTAPNLIQTIEDRLREEEWMIYEWSPIHLRNILNQWYLKGDVKDVGALKVWQDSCHYLYLPRLINDSVFRNALNQGVETEDFFAFASGKEGDRYLDFTFGRASIATLDESSLLIDREAAVAYRERTTQPPQPTPDPGGMGIASLVVPPHPAVEVAVQYQRHPRPVGWVLLAHPPQPQPKSIFTGPSRLTRSKPKWTLLQSWMKSFSSSRPSLASTSKFRLKLKPAARTDSTNPCNARSRKIVTSCALVQRSLRRNHDLDSTKISYSPNIAGCLCDYNRHRPLPTRCAWFFR